LLNVGLDEPSDILAFLQPAQTKEDWIDPIVPRQLARKDAAERRLSRPRPTTKQD
jgi:hypothetical protein